MVQVLDLEGGHDVMVFIGGAVVVGECTFVTNFDEVVVVEAQVLEVMHQRRDYARQYLIYILHFIHTHTTHTHTHTHTHVRARAAKYLNATLF
jgi:hypothetical protein